MHAWRQLAVAALCPLSRGSVVCGSHAALARHAHMAYLVGPACRQSACRGEGLSKARTPSLAGGIP